MKNNIIIQLFLALCVCCACSSDNDQHIDPIPGGDDLVQIRPTTNLFIPNNSETRAGEVDKGVVDKDVAINASFFRIDAPFLTWPAFSPISATVSVVTNDLTKIRTVNLNPTQYYDGNKETRLIAVHPVVTAGEWLPGTVTKTVNGYTDIMVTSLVECTRTKQPVMKFDHLLTQIEVSVIATDAQVSNVWGTINSITLMDRAATCKIEFPAPNADIVANPNLANPTVSFTDAGGDLVLCERDGSGNASSMTLPTVAGGAVFGYCMFPPVTTSSTLSLVVETTKKTVSVAVPPGTYAANHYYKIQLSLTATDIVPTVTIAEWEKGTLTPIEVIL